MRALVVYESMYGNTHVIAEAIARGLRPAYAVQVVSVAEARYEQVGRYDLVVVGGPTHAHGMSTPGTRQSAITASGLQAEHLQVEPDAAGMGLRFWLDSLGLCNGHAAAFDTRLHAHALLTGKASKGIAGMLHTHGFQLVAEPISFLVDRHNHLLVGEEERAERWGANLATKLPLSHEH
ncbi:MAG TPA: flavodoxin domain-containing protein [Propionibacteriaceae bacterium]